MFKEFKAFIMRGNVVDLAVAVIIGAAFGAIVSSLVTDIITPLILKPALQTAGVDDIANWKPGGILLGKFIATVINFIVVGFVIFILVKAMNLALKKKKEEETSKAPAGPTQEELLTEIRDLLKNK
jgi:large conductance mechanosensitive channel